MSMSWYMSHDWIEDIVSAWTGHRCSAEFLVKTMQPRVVVELGVDYGYSTFVFANALQGSEGYHYGLDMFEGDVHAGMRNTYLSVMENITSHNLTNVDILVYCFCTNIIIYLLDNVCCYST